MEESADELVRLAFRLQSIDQELASLSSSQKTDSQLVAATALSRERTILRHRLVIASLPA